jgi:hypothetical protein
VAPIKMTLVKRPDDVSVPQVFVIRDSNLMSDG